MGQFLEPIIDFLAIPISEENGFCNEEGQAGV